MRNELQMKKERKLAKSFFPTIKAREKYGTPSPEFLRKKGGFVICMVEKVYLRKNIGNAKASKKQFGQISKARAKIYCK